MKRFGAILGFGVLFLLSVKSFATCNDLPNHEMLKKALNQARGEKNGGLNNDMWGVLVDRTGSVCAVAFTGTDVDSQWPGSRMIAAQKANTANAFSLKGFAITTSRGARAVD